MRKRMLLVIGLVTLVLVLFAGCTTQEAPEQMQAHLTMRANITTNNEAFARDPVPFLVHVKVYNTGTENVTDVRADIVFSYKNTTLASRTLYFGDIPPGETSTRDEEVLVSFPQGHPALSVDDLKFTIDNVYANGRKQTDVIIT
jgi:hypothetical protein